MIDEVRFLNIINGVLAREGDTTWGEVREVLLNELCGARLDQEAEEEQSEPKRPLDSESIIRLSPELMYMMRDIARGTGNHLPGMTRKIIEDTWMVGKTITDLENTLQCIKEHPLKEIRGQERMLVKLQELIDQKKEQNDTED